MLAIYSLITVYEIIKGGEAAEVLLTVERKPRIRDLMAKVGRF